MQKYFSQFEEYKELYDFSIEELKLNINDFSTKYSEFKIALQTNKNNIYSSFFETNETAIHLLVENGSFSSSYYTEESFDFSFQSFISKLVLISHDELFPFQPVYPLKLNNSLFPYAFVDTQFNNIELNLEQTYLYEVLISFYTYINELYGLSQTIEENITKGTDTNYMILSIFVGGLISGNLIILLICILFLRTFESLSNIKLNSFDKLLTNDKVLETLNEKIEIISDLSLFFFVNPCKTIARLGVITKNKNKHQSNNEKSKSKDKNDNEKKKEIKEKNFNTGQFSFIFKIILCFFFFLYLIYSLMFVYVYSYSFHQLRDITYTLEYSANAEENVFLFIAIYQMFHYFTYDPSSFYNIIPKVIDPSINGKTNYLVILLNQLQIDWKNEYDYKNGKNKVPIIQI